MIRYDGGSFSTFPTLHSFPPLSPLIGEVSKVYTDHRQQQVPRPVEQTSKDYASISLVLGLVQSRYVREKFWPGDEARLRDTRRARRLGYR